MIEVNPTSLPGVLKITKRWSFKDHRGCQEEIYRKKEYFDAGITIDFVQQNLSVSCQNVLRGLHGDSKTWKLISCLYGEFYLVVLNYDESSSYFGKWESFILNLNGLQVLIPPMHANGHLILSDWAAFHYNVSEYYTSVSDQFSVRWDDPCFNISWPIQNPILSARDSGTKTRILGGSGERI